MPQQEIVGPQEILDTLQAPGIPHYYVNGSKNVLGTADIAVIFEQNGKAVFTVNMSHSMAKNLAGQLRELVQHLEVALGAPILTLSEVEAKVQSPPSGKKQ